MYLLSLLFLWAAQPAHADLNLGPQEIVQAGGHDLQVLGYSVPCHVDWNEDGLADLIVGEGSGGYPEAKIRVYLNSGSVETPLFTDFSYVQSAGGDLGCAGSG